MRSYVKLCEADRERLGGPEKLYYELVDITAREQATLQQEFRYHVPEDLAEAMGAMIDRERQQIRKDPDVVLAVTWLGLRRAGVLSGRRSEEMVAELAALDVSLVRTELGFEPDEGEAPGKDESSTPTKTSAA